MRVIRIPLAALLAATSMVALVVGAGGPAEAGSGTATITNFIPPTSVSPKNPATTFDVDGNAVDAHQGSISLFNGVYYWYGERHDCGYDWTHGPSWCGIDVYQSTDMQHWTSDGLMFPRTDVGYQECATGSYCVRPHVIYNSTTKKYVTWIQYDGNASDGSQGPRSYLIFTADNPAGPFTKAADSAPPTFIGDQNLFKDSNGDAYMVWIDESASHMDVTKLSADYLSFASGASNVWIGNPTYNEAPEMFERNGTYYITDSDACGYCAGTPTHVFTASSPSGPWTQQADISPNSCGGQPTNVAVFGSGSNATYLYQSDLFDPNDTGSYTNQGRATYYFEPLSFTGTTINPLTCANTVTVPLPSYTAGSNVALPDLDQSDGQTGMTHAFACDIAGQTEHLQSFVVGRSGYLTSVAVTTFQYKHPDAPLIVDLKAADSSGHPTGAVLSESVLPPASLGYSQASQAVGYSPRNVAIYPANLAVTSGSRYAVILRSAATTGCYGLDYNDASTTGLYPAGHERKSTDGGQTWNVDVTDALALKFYTTVASTAPTLVSVDDATVGSVTGTWAYSSGWTACGSCSTTSGGLYGGTNTYSNASGSTATFKFTGDQVTLYGALDPRAGRAMVSIDDGPETPISTYAATRVEDAAEYVSPTLLSGAHTLTVRVTGVKTGGSDAYVAIDRAAVTTR